MSEEKLYAVKNDEGKYWNFEDQDGFWKLSTVLLAAFTDEESAKSLAHDHGGHVVTLIEASKPVEVSENEAKMLATLMDGDLMPVSELSYFVRHAEQLPEKESIEREDRLMRAYVNGYTVAKEKKYNVKVPHTDDSYFYKIDDEYCNAGDSYHLEGMADKKWFTDAEIEHYGLQDCERVEINMEDSNGN